MKEAQRETFKSCCCKALWFLERRVLPEGYAAGKKCSVTTEKAIHDQGWIEFEDDFIDVLIISVL